LEPRQGNHSACFWHSIVKDASRWIISQPPAGGRAVGWPVAAILCLDASPSKPGLLAVTMDLGSQNPELIYGLVRPLASTGVANRVASNSGAAASAIHATSEPPGRNLCAWPRCCHGVADIPPAGL